MQVSNKEAYENSLIDWTKRSSLSQSEAGSPKPEEQFDPDIQVDACSADAAKRSADLEATEMRVSITLVKSTLRLISC
jgi:hypothetical protein